MLPSLALSTVMAATGVLPGELVADHTQPYHYGQPVIRRFERQLIDLDRRTAWNGFVGQLKVLWARYRAAGSTPEAYREYMDDLEAVRRDYIYDDIHYAPVVIPERETGELWP